MEGARWDVEEQCLRRSHPKVLVEELPILTIIPTEVHRLKLQVLKIFYMEKYILVQLLRYSYTIEHDNIMSNL